MNTFELNYFSISGFDHISNEGVKHVKVLPYLSIVQVTEGSYEIALENNKLVIDFHIIVAYGVSIVAVSENLISNVKYKVEEFTGIEIEKINIFVEGVRVID